MREVPPPDAAQGGLVHPRGRDKLPEGLRGDATAAAHEVLQARRREGGCSLHPVRASGPAAQAVGPDAASAPGNSGAPAIDKYAVGVWHRWEAILSTAREIGPWPEWLPVTWEIGRHNTSTDRLGRPRRAYREPTSHAVFLQRSRVVEYLSRPAV